MRRARVLVHGKFAGILEKSSQTHYQFIYDTHYQGPPVSLTMPLKNPVYEFNQFPPFFEGLLPEGVMLEALLRKYKLDRYDYFGQLLIVGQHTVGAVTIKDIK